jgi:hypothetical protein
MADSIWDLLQDQKLWNIVQGKLSQFFYLAIFVVLTRIATFLCSLKICKYYIILPLSVCCGILKSVLSKCFFNSGNIFLEILLRLCLLGSNCDMFQYGTDKTCQLMPHTPLKEENLFDVVVRDPSAVYSVYVLQCSTPYENVLKNNDPYSQSYEGFIFQKNKLQWAGINAQSFSNSYKNWAVRKSRGSSIFVFYFIFMT